MRKAFMHVFSLLCLIMFVPNVFAAEADKNDTKTPKFKPSLSVGYAFSAQNDFVFDGVNGASLGGVRKITTRIPSMSGLYISGDFQYNFTDRLCLSVSAHWALPLANSTTGEDFNDNVGNREWDSDKRDWVSADILVSYAFLKNVSFVKDLSGVAGIRGDYQNIKFKNAHNNVIILSSPADTANYEIYTYSPVIGVSTTFKGFKAGIFGGDIKLGMMGSPLVYTSLKYNETFVGGLAFNADEKFWRCMFWNFSAEMTAISVKLGQTADLSVIAFGQYTQYYMNNDVTITYTPSGETNDFKFTASPNLAVVGLKLAIAF